MRGCVLMVLAVLGVLTAVDHSAADDDLDRLPLGDAGRAFELAAAPAGSFFDCREAKELNLEAMVAQLAQARVVLLGEEHTSLDQKLVQAQIVEKLASKVPKLVLGMEFFERGDGDLLARWTRGELDGEAFLRASHWYDRGSYRFEYYRPVMEAARRAGLRIVGLNVPREVPQAVNRGGLAALSQEQRREVGEVETTGSPQHRYLVSRYFGSTVAQLPPAWFENMYAAQCLWDVVMARSVLAELGETETMVVVVGSGHVAYDLGIARRIHEERAASGLADLRVASFCPVTAPAPAAGEVTGHPVGPGMTPQGQERALFVRSLADMVGVFPDSGGVDAYPTLGVRLEAGSEGTLQVATVWPGSRAEAAGVEAGDRILDVNGVTPVDLTDLRLILARTEWGQRLDLRVRRDDQIRDVALLLEPEVQTSEQTVAPGWTIEPAGVVEPESSAPVAVLADSHDEEPHRILVSHPGQARRVEVWRGRSLDEVHELDAAQRVVHSLYRQPLADGAVELRFERDPDGTVTRTARCDRCGRRIGQ